MTKQVIRAARAAIAGDIAPATVLIDDGRIAAVLDGAEAAIPTELADDFAEATQISLADDRVLLPGLVDTHVHINEPGRTHWEGFATATQAAAAGGISTMVDMPLNSIPSTTTSDALEQKVAASEGKLSVDVALWGGIVPDNIGTGDLRNLWDAGVIGFKCFLIHSGVDDFPNITYDQLRAAMEEIAEFDGLVIAHCEDPELVAQATAEVEANGGGDETYTSFLRTRPPESEREAVRQFIAAAEATGCRAHIVHVTEAGSVELIRAAKERGSRISGETCPHYIALSAENIPDGATSQKCCPPIRDAANREHLWRGLQDGTLSFVVTDHSPSPADLKLFAGTDAGQHGFGIDGAGGTRIGLGGQFAEAWGGIASLEVSLPITWTTARLRGFSLADVVRWMCTNTAAFAGFDDRGEIAVGKRADLVEFAPDETFLVIPENLHQRHPVSAYASMPLAGVVKRTWLGGNLAFNAYDKDPFAATSGQIVYRQEQN